MVTRFVYDKYVECSTRHLGCQGQKIMIILHVMNLPRFWWPSPRVGLRFLFQILSMVIVTLLLHLAETQHQFNAHESDWGFTSFMPLGELYDPGRGYLVNDTCIVEADVAVRRVVDYWSHDSKKETGFVGLKNQGATCYMNSLLQTLYHIPYFRKVSILGLRNLSYCCYFTMILHI